MTRDFRPWLAAIVDSSDEAIFSKTMDGTILSWNAAAERLYGYSAHETIGRHVSLLVPPERAGEVDDLMSCLAQGERVVDHRTMRRRKDGTVIRVSLTLSPVRDADGALVGAAAFVRDADAESDLAEARREAETLEAVGRLAGGIAHDFNNLLTAVLGYGTIALAELEPGGARSAVEEMMRAAGRAGELTAQLLAFSRRTPSERSRVDVNAVVLEVEPMLQRIIGEDIELSVALADDLPPVESDRTQIERVVVNLVANARDAMPRGGRVTISTGTDLVEADEAAHAGRRPGLYTVLSVSDTGIGMDEATRARVFEPFFTTKPPGKGTGLGLATVQGVVEQSSGYVDVRTEPGRGTVFAIRLPAAEGLVAHGSADATAEGHGGSETILVVEDDVRLLELAATVLEHAGYEVIRAASPEAALEIARRRGEDVDLLVSDVIMPRISGPELVRRLAAEGRDLPTVFMSGYPGRSELLDLVGDYLDKPFAPQLLLERVRAALDWRSEKEGAVSLSSSAAT